MFDVMIIASDQSAVATHPRVRPFDLPTLPVPTKRSAILDSGPAAILAAWDDELDPTPLQTFPMRVAVVGPIGDYPLRLGPRPPRPVPRDADRGERGFEERDFTW